MKLVRNDRGFTVVELLVALSILSLVAMALVSVFDTARRLFLTVNEAERQLEEVALVRRLLNESLGQTVGTSQAAIVGDARNLSVRAPGPRVLAFASPVTLNLRPGGEQHGLVASWTSHPDNRGGGSPSRRIVGETRKVQFAYFSPGTGWLDSWSDVAELPALVRVTIGGSAGAGAAAELIFATRLLAQARCEAPNRSCGAAR